MRQVVYYDVMLDNSPRVPGNPHVAVQCGHFLHLVRTQFKTKDITVLIQSVNLCRFGNSDDATLQRPPYGHLSLGHALGFSYGLDRLVTNNCTLGQRAPAFYTNIVTMAIFNQRSVLLEWMELYLIDMRDD